MYGLDNASGVNVMPKTAPVSSTTPLWFTEGGAGLAASYPGQDWYNMVQAELLGILTAAGVKPEKGKLTQLAEAIKKIVGSAGFQPSGDYATTTALSDGLKGKLDKTGGGLKGDNGVLYLNSITANRPLFMSFFDAASKQLGYVGRPDSKEDIALVNSSVGSMLRLTSGNGLTFNDVNVMTASYVTQTTGTSTTRVMSEKAVTDALDNKVNYTAIVQTTGQNQYSIMSQRSVTNSMLGIEQVWKNMLSERQSSTTYTNTTGKPISVSVTQLGGMDISLEVSVNGVVISNPSSTGASRCFITFIVPTGGTYKITHKGSEIINWSELR